jgi:hypothetical protein
MLPIHRISSDDLAVDSSSSIAHRIALCVGLRIATVVRRTVTLLTGEHQQQQRR